MSDQQQQSEAETRDDGGEPEINVEAEQQAETTTSSTPAASTEAKGETKPQEQEQTQEELDNELEKVRLLLISFLFVLWNSLILTRRLTFTFSLQLLTQITLNHKILS